MWTLLAKMVAILAPLLNSFQFAPQAMHVWKRGHAKGVFTKTIYLALVVQLLWITHAVFIEDIALLVAGGVNAAFTLFILSYM